jgi:CarD family transcriptional regulator
MAREADGQVDFSKKWYNNAMGRKNEMRFSIGDKVVYPGYGVGEVKSAEEREFNDRKELFLVLVFTDTENISKVMIPTSSISEIGLREPSSAKIVREAFDFLKNGTPEVFLTWKDRFTAHTIMVAKGDLISISRVLKSLFIQNKKKPLSFREKKMYQRCLLLMSSEAALVKNLSREKIEAEIQAALDGNS